MGNNWLTGNRKLIAPKTTQRRLTSLRAFCRWSKWGDLFGDYSAPQAAPPQPHPLPEGVDGVRRMIKAARNDQQRALIAFCGLAGLRVHEALYVELSHFNFADMELTVHGKGEKQRVVPISDEAWQVIAPACVRVGNPHLKIIGLKDRFARRVITKTAERAHLQRHVSSHDLRATFATELYNATLDRRLVQYLLGHAKGDTTDVYIGRTREQAREAVAKLEKL